MRLYLHISKRYFITVLGTACAVALGLVFGSDQTVHGQRHATVRLIATAAGSPIERAGLSADGSGWALTTAGLEVTRNGGTSFQTVAAPFGLNTITDVATAGSSITVAARVPQSSGSAAIEIAQSDNTGGSWRTSVLPAGSGAPGYARLATDGTSVAGVLVTDESSSAFSDGDWYSTPDGGTTWNHDATPSGGTVTVAGGDLWLVGGPLRSNVYVSTTDGVSWSPVSLPAADVGASTVIVGSLADGRVVAATSQTNAAGTGITTNVIASPDGGASWTPLATLTSDGSVGGGVGPEATLTNGTVLVAPPGASSVYVISAQGSTVSTTQSSISAPGTAIGALSSGGGSVLATVVSSGCPNGKASCADSSSLLSSTDSGVTWSPITLSASESD
ncbi:MAG TPA: sialidase family protein [Solirubrobacteraceae bacterium]|jgi:hypothetical protein